MAVRVSSDGMEENGGDVVQQFVFAWWKFVIVRTRMYAMVCVYCIFQAHWWRLRLSPVA